MDQDSLIIAVFCRIDDMLSAVGKVRRAGPMPTLTDAEVLTMEVVGEYLGFDTDKRLFGFFRDHYPHFFPALRRLHRTTIVRQAANLWRVKERMWRSVLELIVHDPAFALVDSMPIPVCRFARAYRCKLFRPDAAFGRDTLERQTFFGFRLHVRLCWPGVITQLALLPANVSEHEGALDLSQGTTGILVGDRNYHAPKLSGTLKDRMIRLIAPYKSKAKDTRPRLSHLISRVRYRIETVFGQLVDRYHIKRSKARDLWHLASRVMRKVLSHTIMVLLNQQEGRFPATQLALITP